jgi:hypothetical protein
MRRRSPIINVYSARVEFGHQLNFVLDSTVIAVTTRSDKLSNYTI